MCLKAIPKVLSESKKNLDSEKLRRIKIKRHKNNILHIRSALKKRIRYCLKSQPFFNFYLSLENKGTLPFK
ncbi:hypothetical protein BSPWISOXPB_2005 [uncultured Gammaproteobacteria bacterium]|nr:hypothetical protein BSPWISOXPB_2005 [uncultured Gammaproteobacteria bacterium]